MTAARKNHTRDKYLKQFGIAENAHPQLNILDLQSMSIVFQNTFTHSFYISTIGGKNIATVLSCVNDTLTFRTFYIYSSGLSPDMAAAWQNVAKDQLGVNGSCANNCPK